MVISTEMLKDRRNVNTQEVIPKKSSWTLNNEAIGVQSFEANFSLGVSLLCYGYRQAAG